MSYHCNVKYCSIVAYAVSRLRGDALVQVAAYDTLKKRTYINHQRWTSLWRSFAPSLVPRPAVPSPQSYVQPAIHSSPSFILLRNLLFLQSPRSIHDPPPSTALQPAAHSLLSSTHDPPSFTVHGPFQSSPVYSPPSP